MTSRTIKPLPFWETVGRSFKYVLKNKKLQLALIPVAVVLFLLQIVLKLPLMCSYNESFCTQGWQNTVSAIVSVIAAVGIIINYCRSIICKEKVDFYSAMFFKRMAFYILWSFLLTFVVGIPVAIFIMIMSFTGIELNTMLTVSLFLFFVVGVLLAPLIVALPALAVDDYKVIKISKLFTLAKGNKMSIFFGQFIVMVPYMLLSKMFAYLYVFSGVNSYIMNLCFVFVTICLSVLDASFKGAFFAHIYQFLKYYDKDK